MCDRRCVPGVIATHTLDNQRVVLRQCINHAGVGGCSHDPGYWNACSASLMAAKNASPYFMSLRSPTPESFEKSSSVLGTTEHISTKVLS